MKRLLAMVAVALAAPLAFAAFGTAPKVVAGAHAANAVEISRDGEYTSRDDVAAYVRKFSGALPKNFITKAKARELGWQGGPLEPYAPGKSIGGDRFGNYERRLPLLKGGFYKECDIETITCLSRRLNEEGRSSKADVHSRSGWREKLREDA